MTPLTEIEWIVSVVLGAGVLGVAAGLKATPPELVEKIPVEFDENKSSDNDVVMGAFKKMQKLPAEEDYRIN